MSAIASLLERLAADAHFSDCAALGRVQFPCDCEILSVVEALRDEMQRQPIQPQTEASERHRQGLLRDL
jgi:hypothetical protein